MPASETHQVSDVFCTVTNFPVDGLDGYGFVMVDEGPHKGEKAFIKPQVIRRLREERGWDETYFGRRVKMRLIDNSEKRANGTPWLALDEADPPERGVVTGLQAKIAELENRVRVLEARL